MASQQFRSALYKLQLVKKAGSCVIIFKERVSAQMSYSMQ